MEVYKAINAVQAAMAKEGISKNRKNMTPGQNYNFRGIDEVYNALSPLLAEHGLCVLPRILSREVATRASQKGNTIFTVVVEAEFDFVSAADGSKHTIRTFGEAMDSSDKATNKAMSAAYKYAALMAFAIPTEGDNDADAVTHELAHIPQEQLITPEQLQQLNDLIDQVGGDKEKMCAHYKIKSLNLMNTGMLADALHHLNKKLEGISND